MIGLCEVCKKIGLDAFWPKVNKVAKYCRCDHCKLYPKSGTLTLFQATSGELKKYVDMNPTSQLLALGTLSDGRTGDPLYCISYWSKPLYKPGKWKMGELYMHGKDEGEVRYAFLISHQDIRVNIIGIAPVVGWFVENENEGKLIAS